MVDLTPPARLKAATEHMDRFGLILWRDPCCYQHPLCYHMFEAIRGKLDAAKSSHSAGEKPHG